MMTPEVTVGSGDPGLIGTRPEPMLNLIVSLPEFVLAALIASRRLQCVLDVEPDLGREGLRGEKASLNAGTEATHRSRGPPCMCGH
jgi:hypothetical protein